MNGLYIDDQFVVANAGDTLLDVACRAGFSIPTLCHSPDLTPVGSCRVCLVEIEGQESLVPACHHPASRGLRIRTKSPRVIEARRHVLQFLAARIVDSLSLSHRRTAFDDLLTEYGVELQAMDSIRQRWPVDPDPHPFLKLDMNACVLCTRCVRACQEIQGRFVWGIEGRGVDALVAPGAGTTLLEARCESCGACALHCPTGAIVDRRRDAAPLPERLVRTTCGYCGVGCQFDLNVVKQAIVGVTSTPDAPVNGDRLCVKGRYGYEFIHHPDRLSRPRVRAELLQDPRHERTGPRGTWVDTDWNTALDIVARRLAHIQQTKGPQSLAVLASAKCSNEENFLLQKFARQVLGTNHIDHCARLCHASTVAGLQMCFGSGAMSNSMDDVAGSAAAFFIIGSNTTEQHPVFGTMLRQAVLKRAAPLILADPRKIDLAEFATLHLRHRPGTDVALLNGLMHIILRDRRHDAAFIESRCEEFGPFAESLSDDTPEATSRVTGVDVSSLEQAAAILGRSRPAAVIWAMGITQHVTGVLNVLALGNLQMLLGNLGVPGGGVNPLRGQNNVQGACDMGALPNVLPGYQSLTDPAIRQTFENAWRLTSRACPSSAVLENFQLPEEPGLTVTEIISSVGAGSIAGLLIVGENPAATDPDLPHVRDCLDHSRFLVVEEIFPSATTEFADVLLPAASFAERSGTFTNTERRIQIFREAIPPIGEARAEWTITQELARRILTHTDRAPTGTWAGWDYSSPADILREIGALTPIYRGVTWPRLEAGERLQWPVPDEHHPGTPILHIDSFPRGKGLFHVVRQLPPAELPDDAFPLLLTTGRILPHWHAGETTRRVTGLLALAACPELEISFEDARKLAISDGDLATVESRRGVMQARARVGDRVPFGVVFGTFHFGGTGNVNELTHAALDPVARIPEYKVCAVKVTRAGPAE